MAAVVLKHMASSFAKLKKFKGVDFKRWKKKMHFMLSSMSVVYVLTTPMPKDGGENPTVEQVRKRAKYDNDDYVCRGLILNDFKHTLKHLKEKLTLIEFGSHLRIKESLKVQDSDKPKGNNVAGPLVVNMVEHNNSSRANRSSTKGSEDGSSNPLKGQSMFNKSHQVYYVTYVSEAFFVQDDDVAWWVDSEATVHVCKDRSAGKEAKWLKNLLLEIFLWVKPTEHISIRCDSASTLAKAYSQMYNRKSRHLGVRHNMIHELITNGVISIEFVRSQQNLADHLTKGLARDLVIKAEAHVLQIILKMCLEPAGKEDEVANFSMVNLFEKVLSRSMNKKEPPM
nr:zinc finger, CCHC-type [Tanacetum cinerariifolium]